MAAKKKMEQEAEAKLIADKQYQEE